MLDVPSANAKTKAIGTAFAAIGLTATDTRMPPCKRNIEALAWEYHVAALLLRLSEARKKLAQKKATEAGVMFDPEKAPMAIGTDQLIYGGDIVEISVAVTTPTTRVDVPALIADLEKSGVKLQLLNRLVNKHTTENRAPHKFRSSLATKQ